MKQKTRIASKLFAALVVLTLISCCFLGTTMARYTSTSSGAAQISVAEWDIGITGNATGNATANFGKLSPSQTGYADLEDNETDTSHSTAYTLVAKIVNNSEVAANVTVSANATPTFTMATVEDTTVSFDVIGYSYGTEGQANTVVGKGASQSQAEALFSIALYYSYSETSSTSGATKIASNTVIALEARGGTNKTAYIYAIVTWTTDYDAEGVTANERNNGALQDAIDTWVGENVTNVKWALSYTAVQASELPTT